MEIGNTQINHTKVIPYLNYYNYGIGWCSIEDFWEILKKEKNRSDRNGSPLSYVIFKLVSLNNGDFKDKNPNFLSSFNELILFISENTRNYDIKCFFKATQIGVLLLDTPLNGAKLFVEKIIRKLQENKKDSQIIDFTNFIKSIIISTYPLNQLENCGDIKGIPVSIKNLIIVKKSNNFKNSLKIKTRSKALINWEIEPMEHRLIVQGQLESFSLKTNKKIAHFFLKRMIDLIGSIVAIIIFAPIMLIISLAIKLTSRGPVLFKQQRIGYGGRPFTMLKFRTMRVDCDEKIHKKYIQKLINGEEDKINFGTSKRPVFKLAKDPRITPLGKFLRRTSLDELPQFFNVFKNEMSLVGPRPPIPYELYYYKNWHLRRVFEVKPGITGLWQVYGRSKTTFDEMVRMDLKYVEQQSLFLDIKIILKTFFIVLKADGAL